MPRTGDAAQGLGCCDVHSLDRHTLTIEIEDNDLEADKLVYLPDIENSGVAPQMPRWRASVERGAAFVLKNTDHTNYGDLSLPTGHESNWSRFVFSVGFVRPGFGIFVKLFTGLFIATAIAIQALRIPADVDRRARWLVGRCHFRRGCQPVPGRGGPPRIEWTDPGRPPSYSFVRLHIHGTR